MAERRIGRLPGRRLSGWPSRCGRSKDRRPPGRALLLSAQPSLGTIQTLVRRGDGNHLDPPAPFPQGLP